MFTLPKASIDFGSLIAVCLHTSTSASEAVPVASARGSLRAALDARAQRTTSAAAQSQPRAERPVGRRSPTGSPLWDLGPGAIKG